MTSPATPPPGEPTLLERPPVRERRFLADALRTETVGGLVLLGATLVALVWANFPVGDTYTAVRDFHFGIPALGLDLSVGHWAADGLLTVFFFVAGIELKRELVVGELRNPAAAALPVVAAVCGMVVPALCYVVITAPQGGDLNGWAVPMATDIAFALGVLAVIGSHLPAALRAFLLTLAVADDLGAIVVIAVFYTGSLNLPALGGALVGLALFWLLHHKGVTGWYLYLPLAVVIWGLTFNSGIHATIAGVAMGMLLRVTPRPGEDGVPGEETSPGEELEHLLRPLSAGLAVPLFALFSAGVPLSGEALTEALGEPEALGVAVGLFAGKMIGVFGGTYLAARFTRARLNPDLGWADMAALAMLAGIGFTVSLLITELAFDDPATTEHVKAAVLMGSLASAVVGAVLLRLRDRVHRRLWEQENRDENRDGVPDLDEAELAAEKAAAYEGLHERLTRQWAQDRERGAAPSAADQAGHDGARAEGDPGTPGDQGDRRPERGGEADGTPEG